jgi:PAS domain S-box-containing protein
MMDKNKTKAQLISELEEMRTRIASLEVSKVERDWKEQEVREAGEIYPSLVDELRESEQRYKSLFKNNHSVMLLIDPASADIIDANPAAYSFYGWTHEELTSMKITDINMLPNEQVFEEMEQAKLEERNHFFFRHRLANEEIRDVEVYSSPIRLHGKELLYSIIHDISDRKRAEEALRKREAELEIRASELEELNSALRVLLKKREEDQKELEEKVLSNVKELVLPYVERLKKGALGVKRDTYLNILQSNLENIVSPFVRKLSSTYLGLTPTEIHVANLVKEARDTKTIAQLLNMSPRTVETHRQNIRKKLGLKNKKANLRTHLLSMQ